MEKIKGLLHHDSSTVDSTSTTESSEHKHSLFHRHSDEAGSSSGMHHHSKDGDVLSKREFEQGHIHHGEIEHGGHQHEHVHSHEQSHLHSEKLKDHDYDHSHHHDHEKHIMHERSAMKDGGDLYKTGMDPTMNREVLSTSSHSGGIERERIDEGKIVKETVKEVSLHKIQPVIHRNREQKEIRHIVEPHKKTKIKDTKIHHRERDIDLGVRREASTLETSRDIGTAPHIEASREFLGRERQQQELPVRIEEHVHRKVEEHIHPVIYKEVLKPKVTEETHHIYEKVKERPIETYEVKDIAHSHGEGLREAEREFFNRESSRGIVLGEGHSCDRDIDSHHHHKGHEHLHKSHEHHKGHEHLHKSHEHQKGHEHHHKSHDHDWKKHSGDYHKAEYISGPSIATTRQEPIIGHHQNIGAHHLAAGAIPQGHNTAYDAALCNQCTSNEICSHSTRDADRMQKMNEKKIAKDQKLGDKQAKKMHKGSSHSKSVNVV